MSDLSTKPRSGPIPGRRKATEVYCGQCQRFHRTIRHAKGVDPCPYGDPPNVIDFPAVRTSRDPNPDR